MCVCVCVCVLCLDVGVGFVLYYVLKLYVVVDLIGNRLISLWYVESMRECGVDIWMRFRG